MARAPRDPALDVAKGLCVVSMTSAHLASGTLVDRLLHLPPYVDGASGFILMSGLVLGMVQRRRLTRMGERRALLALARRARLIYLLHVTSVLLALALAHLGRSSAWWLPSVEQEGGWRSATAGVLQLRVLPPYMDVLSLYVVLFALSAVATALLVRGRLGVLSMTTAAIYGVSLIWPSATTLGAGRWEQDSFNWGGWQLVFLSALSVGWYWEEHELARRLVSKPVLYGSAVLAAVLACCGLIGGALATTPLAEGVVGHAFDKNAAGPGRFIMAWSAFLLLYGSLVHVLQVVRGTWTSPLERIGRRSLDSYVLLTLVMVVAVAGFDLRIEGPGAVLLAAVALAVMLFWSSVRDVRDARSATTRSTPGQAGDAMDRACQGSRTGLGPASVPHGGRQGARAALPSS